MILRFFKNGIGVVTDAKRSPGERINVVIKKIWPLIIVSNGVLEIDARRLGGGTLLLLLPLLGRCRVQQN